MVQIRRIRADEGMVYRDVRIRGLADTPSAFVTTVAVAESRPEAYWRNLAADSARGEERVLFVADSGDCFEGTAGGALEEDGAVVEVIGVWVDPAFRGQGIAAALVQQALAWGRARGAVDARLWVHDQNDTAIRLYQRLGFTMTDHAQTFGEQNDRRRCMMVRSLDSSPKPLGGNDAAVGVS